jgi:prepilin-type processing-associated H-X9-DG protein
MVGVDGCAGSLGPSSRAFPPGWGGSTTDSVVQGACGAGSSLFVQSVAVPWTLNELKTSAMADTSKQVAVADAGIITEQLDRTSWVAYPEDCRIDHVLCNTTCGGDWAGCSWSRPCSPQQVALGGDGKTASDAQSRKTLFGSRHLGGSNLGFCDGHAKWMSSEAILFGGENWSGYGKDPPDLYGLGVCFVPDAVNKYQ